MHNGSQKNETLVFYFGHHEHLDIIASAGFTNEGKLIIKSIFNHFFVFCYIDFLYGSFGKGLYFRTNINILQKEVNYFFL